MQVPALNIFESSLRRGKFDQSRQLSNGSLLEFAHILPMDAVFDSPEDVPEEVSPLHDTCLQHSYPGNRLLSKHIYTMLCLCNDMQSAWGFMWLGSWNVPFALLQLTTWKWRSLSLMFS